jgi:hypothetical protein
MKMVWLNAGRRDWGQYPGRCLPWALLICLGALCGCADKPASPAAAVTAPPAPVREPASGPKPGGEAVNPPETAGFTAPLTGLPVKEEIRQRPVMVMVENSPQARPQSGLDQADLVYEILAEGDITRFAAVFQSQSPGTIGPVRSIRPYYVEIGDGLDALIVHAGWSQDAMNLIADRNLAHFDEVYGDGKYYWRSSDRNMPHNLYTSIAKIREGAVNKKFRSDWNGPLLHFLKPGQLPAAGSAAAKISIPYLNGYNVSYEYNGDKGVYERFMNGKPHTDSLSGKQLEAANLLIVETEHRVVDSAGRREVDVYGPGQGWLAQAGTVRSITWERKEGIIRAYASGKELPLLPGRTWVQVVPAGTKPMFE